MQTENKTETVARDLTGGLSKVVNHSLDSLALWLILDGIQVDCPLVGAVVEDVGGLNRRAAFLLVPEDQVDPMVEVRTDMQYAVQVWPHL